MQSLRIVHYFLWPEYYYHNSVKIWAIWKIPVVFESWELWECVHKWFIMVLWTMWHRHWRRDTYVLWDHNAFSQYHKFHWRQSWESVLSLNICCTIVTLNGSLDNVNFEWRQGRKREWRSDKILWAKFVLNFSLYAVYHTEESHWNFTIFPFCSIFHFWWCLWWWATVLHWSQ